MELAELGFDHWFQKGLSEAGRPDCRAARVTRVDRDRYLVRNETHEVQAEATGKLLFSGESSQDLPCVGDWVLVQYHNDGTLAIIHGILPRKTYLRRKTPGTRVEYQMLAANIDTAFVTQSCDADFNIRRMERYLIMAREGHVNPVILLTKRDLVGREDLNTAVSRIRNDGIDALVIACSSTTGEGVDEVRQILTKGKTFCLLGSSGVGKTTLLNHLLGREEFATAPVREGDGRGRHTTARRQLILLEAGALLIDTPGMRELGMLGVAESIGDSFPDIHELAGKCRFKDCTHTKETGCAIRFALDEGTLSEERYGSYIKLMKESAFHQLSYVERRRKDRAFGRMVKVVLTQHKKRKF